MKIIRTIWLLAITYAFWPLLILFAVGWLIWCIRCAKQLSETIAYGISIWWRWIKAGVQMNIEFINNGLFGY